jgi:hypothetical protein
VFCLSASCFYDINIISYSIIDKLSVFLNIINVISYSIIDKLSVFLDIINVITYSIINKLSVFLKIVSLPPKIITIIVRKRSLL